MTTLTDIKKLYPNDKVTQVRSIQLFVVHKGNPLLVSYRTVIGVRIGDTWYITTKKYSVSTSRQITEFRNELRQCRTFNFIPDEALQKLINNP